VWFLFSEDQFKERGEGGKEKKQTNIKQQ